MDLHILAITNVTGRECRIEIPMSEIDSSESQWYDLINRKAQSAENQKLCIHVSSVKSYIVMEYGLHG